MHVLTVTENSPVPAQTTRVAAATYRSDAVFPSIPYFHVCTMIVCVFYAVHFQTRLVSNFFMFMLLIVTFSLDFERLLLLAVVSAYSTGPY